MFEKETMEYNGLKVSGMILRKTIKNTG